MLENRADRPIIAYKKLGETPLECLERVRKEKGIEPNTSMTYAGRLDPMAEGIMIILLGDECKDKDAYLGFDKTYEFQILVGFETDTNDLLGLVASSEERFLQVLESPLQSTLHLFTGTFSQKYPTFSSKTVNGKQLFQLALDDKLPSNMPEHEVTIYSLQYKNKIVLEKEKLRKEITNRINLVKGDFRQEAIIKKWEEALDTSNQKEFQILSLVCSCSSGTYIRQLVADISDEIGSPLVTYSIRRTKVGDYTKED